MEQPRGGSLFLVQTLRDGPQVLLLSPLAVALAAVLMLVNAIISLRLSLGMHTQIAIATVRCIIQLSMLGYILVPIFNYGQPWLVLCYAFFMICVSAVEAISRPQHTYKGLFFNTLLTVAGCSCMVMAYAVLLVLHLQPWWQPQYLIPVLGMVLGNTISGISVGLSTVLEELTSGKDKIETLLALGASRLEATRELVQRAMRVAMTPLLNQMSVMGLVSIPGMMTGQILAGSDPAQAARYQMVIMFLLGATSTLAALASIFLAVLHVVDGDHRLRSDRLQAKRSGSALWSAISRAAARVRAACCGCCARRKQRRKVRSSGRLRDEAGAAVAAQASNGAAGGSREGESEANGGAAGEQHARVEVRVEGAGDDLTAPLLQPPGPGDGREGEEQEQRHQQRQEVGVLQSWIGWSLGLAGYRAQ